MMYLADRGRYLVFASEAGSDQNPDWYYNLLPQTPVGESGESGEPGAAASSPSA
jgi:hypothetical protein